MSQGDWAFRIFHEYFRNHLYTLELLLAEPVAVFKPGFSRIEAILPYLLIHFPSRFIDR